MDWETLWKEAVQRAEDKFTLETSSESNYKIPSIDQISDAKLFSNVAQGDFSIIAPPLDPEELNCDFLRCLRNCIAKVYNGLVSQRSFVAALSFRVCLYLIQVVRVFPQLKSRILNVLSVLLKHIESGTHASFELHRRGRQSLAFGNLLSELITLYYLSRTNLECPIEDHIEDHIENLDRLAGSIKETFPVEIRTVPYQKFKNSNFTGNSSAVLGDCQAFHVHHHNTTINLEQGGQKQSQLGDPGGLHDQVLPGHGLADIRGSYPYSMTRKARSLNNKNSQGGETKYEDAESRVHSVFHYPQLETTDKKCGWILGSRIWVDWRRDGTGRILLITGSLGCGKTVIAQTLFGHVSQRTTASRPVLSIRCLATHQNANKDVRAFYLGLVIQLFKICDTAQDDDIQDLLLHYVPVRQQLADCAQSTLVEVIIKLVAACRPSYLFVDDIDECGGDVEQTEIGKFLVSLAEKQLVAVVATVRSDTLFAKDTYTELALRTEPATNEVAQGITQDIWLLINERLNDSPIWRNAKDLTYREDIKRFIFDQGQGNFLHIRISLDTMSTCQDKEDVEKAKRDATMHQELTQRYDALSAIVEKPLNHKYRQRRAQILQMLAVAVNSLSSEQIEGLLCVDPTTGELNENLESLNFTTQLQTLGKGFLEISKNGKVKFYHSTAKRYFQDKPATQTANLDLARKCIAVLRKDSYQEAETASQLLKRHIIDAGKPPTDSCRIIAKESPAYEYAALYFQEHLRLVSTPPADLIRETTQFLRGIEFVTWSESLLDIDPNTASTRRITVYRALLAWTEKWKTDVSDDALGLDNYFKGPHDLLSKSLKDNKEQALQFLPKIRLAEYFNAGPQSSRELKLSHEERQAAVDGLAGALNPHDPLVMKNKTFLYCDYLWMKNFKKARKKLKQLYDIQKETMSLASTDAYFTAWALAGAYIALGDDALAEVLLRDAMKEVQAIAGKQSRLFLLLFLVEGQRLEITGAFEDAASCYKLVLEVNEKLAGPEDGLTIMARVALGAIYRKQRKYDLSQELLEAGYKFRQRTVGINLNVTVDAGFQLAMFYRDRRNYEDCLDALEPIRDSVVFEEDFERRCQLQHIEALVKFDLGEYEEPKKILRDLIDEASGDEKRWESNNRELLWIRLDLSEVMKQHEEDEADILLLFENLVCAKGIVDIDADSEDDEYDQPDPDTDVDDYDKPEPLEQLRAAAEALSLVRSARVKEAEELLERLDLQWKRKHYFNILIQGGPTLDTSVIRPIRRI